MDDDAPEESEVLDEEALRALAARNFERMAALARGAFGQPITVPPGTFELIGVLQYLKAIAIKLDVAFDAEVSALRAVASVLDQLESQAGAMILRQPGPVLDMNRAQRRSPPSP